MKQRIALFWVLASIGLTSCSRDAPPRLVPDPAPRAAPAATPPHGPVATPLAAPTAPSAATSPGAPAAKEAKPSENPLATLLSDYERAQKALADDDVGAARTAAQAFAKAAELAAPNGLPLAVKDALGDATEAAAKLVAAKDLDGARDAFAHLSRAIIALVAKAPELHAGHQVHLCPMAPGYGKWIQPTGPRRNPYFGSKMLKCGQDSGWEP